MLDDLLDEERVSLRSGEDLPAELGTHGRDELDEELLRVRARERLEPDLRQPGPRAPAGPELHELRPPGRDDHQRAGGACEQVLHHVQQGRLRPMQVVDHDDGRAAGREGGQEPRPRETELLADRLGRHPVERVVRDDDAGGRREREEHAVRLLRVLAVLEELANEPAQLVGGGLGLIAEEDPGRAPQDLAERPVRDALTVREAAPAEHPRRAGPATRCRDELLGEPRLADPGVAEDRHERRAALVDAASVQRLEERELASPADELAVGGHELARRGELVGSDDPPGPGGERLPLQISLAERLGLEDPARREVRALARDDLAGLRRLLQSRGDVHHVADDVARDQELVAPHARDGLAGVDADPDGEPDAVPLGELVVQLRQALLHLERRSQGALRVVLTGRRDPEDRHDGVADELLDDAAPALDHRRHRREVLGQERAELLRVELLAQRRRAGQVGEENRDELALGALRRRRIQPVAAGCAEPCADANLHPARRAGLDEGAPARGAEARRAVDLRRARGAARSAGRRHRPTCRRACLPEVTAGT